MTPVDQDIFHGDADGRAGNCMQAAVASVLGLPLEAVPHFAALVDSDGGSRACWESFEDFFAVRGFEVIRMPGNFCPESFYLASGQSPRGVSHMVVMQDGKLVHDPHPSRDGVKEVQEVWMLLARDAERFTLK